MDIDQLTDQEFNDWYDFINLYVLLDSQYAYLEYDKNYPYTSNTVVAERKFNKESPQGNHLLKTTVNDSDITLERVLNRIYDSYKNGKTPDLKELLIDGELLKRDKVISFLKKCHQENLIRFIRIVGDDYVLDENTYNKISFLDNISVHNSSVDKNNIVLEPRNYTVIRGLNSDKELEEDWVIKEDITDQELKEIIGEANNSRIPDKVKIDIRFYNPDRAINLIERLNKYGLSKDIDIKILGYTLTEQSETYKRLLPIIKDRNIEVSYVCCHDLLGEYTKEPYLVDNFYDSELEPSGKTDLQTYIKILEFVEDFQNKTENIDSNIEKIVTAYKYLNDNYYYDADAGSSKDYGATRDIDKILDTDQIVCTGYANLLCIMCRRVGIPMFTYDAPAHSANIARVQEKDENGNVIFDKICTFDPTNDSGYYRRDDNNQIQSIDNKNSYTFFGLDPEESLHRINGMSYITLANLLSIHPDEYFRYASVSASPYFGSYNTDYSALSYMYSMLHLMGYNYDFTKDSPFDVIAELQEKGRIGEIPSDMLLKAITSVERRENNITDHTNLINHMNSIQSNIINSLLARKYLYNMKQPAQVYLNKIDIGDNRNEVTPNVNTYSMSIPNHKKIDIDAIDEGPIYYQELENLSTGVSSNQNNDIPEPTRPVDITNQNNDIPEPTRQVDISNQNNDIPEPTRPVDITGQNEDIPEPTPPEEDTDGLKEINTLEEWVLELGNYIVDKNRNLVKRK